jgi:glucokinase
MTMSNELSGPLVAGVDLGGTKVEAALVDGSGRILSSRRIPTHPERGAAAVLDSLADCLHELRRDAAPDVVAVGVGIAGQVDASTGDVFSAPNLAWRGFPLRKELERRIGLPVRVDNDVRAATLGEWLHGAGRGQTDVFCLFVGTGIGGGVVSGGRLLQGGSNSAGEVGHTPLVFRGRKCSCPNSGCLEAYAGGWAIAERAREAVRSDPEAGRPLVERAGTIHLVTAQTVADLAREGVPLARRLMDETEAFLAAGLVGIINAFNPQVLVLGGGVIEGSPELISGLEAQIVDKALPSAVAGLRLVKAMLGNEAGVVGAAALARPRTAL